MTITIRADPNLELQRVPPGNYHALRLEKSLVGDLLLGVGGPRLIPVFDPPIPDQARLFFLIVRGVDCLALLKLAGSGSSADATLSPQAPVRWVLPGREDEDDPFARASALSTILGGL